MDASDDDSAAESLQKDVASVASRLTPSAAAQRSESRTAQRCYYVTFIIAFIGAVLTCVTSITLFEIIQAEFKSTGDRSIWDTCILYVFDDHTSEWGWACDLTLVLKVLILIATIALIIMHLVLLVKGARVLSPVRGCGMVIYIVVAVVSCTVGVITTTGVEYTCRPGTHKSSYSSLCSAGQQQHIFVKTSEYTAYALAVFYFALFCWNLLTVIAYTIRRNRGGSKPINDPTAPLLASGAMQRAPYNEIQSHGD